MDSGKGVLSKFGFIFASAGAAIGIGNIWRFPYLVTEYGGGTFIFVYILFSLTIGLSLVIAEFMIGRYLGNPITNSFHKLRNSKFFEKAFYLHLFILLVMISFYFIVAGWSLYYFVNSLLGLIKYNSNSSPEYFSAVLDGLLGDPYTLSYYAFAIAGITLFINYKGMVAGIEKTNLLFLPILFVLLVIMMIRILTLDNSAEGLKYIFSFDASKITAAIVPALGQSLFSLSLSVGTMIVYASHTSNKHNLTKSSILIVIMGSAVGLLTSIIIIPALVAFGYPMNAGVALTFLSLPNVFAQISFGGVFATILFLIIFMAAITSTISLTEPCIPYIQRLFGVSRNRAILCLVVFCLVGNTIMTFPLNIWKDVRIFNMDIFTFVSDLLINLLLILGTLLTSAILIIGISKEKVREELTNHGDLKFFAFNLWYFVVRFLSPLVVFITVFFSL